MTYKTALEADEFAKEFLEDEPKAKPKAKRQLRTAKKSSTKPAKAEKSSQSSKSAITKLSKPSKSQKSAKAAKFIELAQALDLAKSAESVKPTKSAKSRKSKTTKSSKVKKNSSQLESELNLTADLQTSIAAEPISQPVIKLDFDTDAIIDFAQLQLALEAKVPRITLANNIMTAENLLINHNVTIDFNGFSIISGEANQAARVLDIRSGKVKLIGKGKIFAMGLRSVAIRAFGAISSGSPNYTQLTIGEEISLFAPDNYGILISPNLGVAYGLTVNFAGRIFARDGICLAYGIRGHEKNLPVINIQNGARITADEQSGVAIEAAGHGKWHIAEARLRAAVGASLRTGEVEFAHTKMLAANGPVFRVEDNTESELTVTVDGGEYLAQSELVIDGLPEGIKEFTIKDGDFCSEDDSMAEALLDIIEVEGGDFQNNVKGTYVQMAENFTEPTAPEANTQVVADTPETAEPMAEANTINTETAQAEADTEVITSDSIAEEQKSSRIDSAEDTKQDIEQDEDSLALASTADAEEIDDWFEQAFAEGERLLAEDSAAEIAELSDDATDEREILQELEAEEAVSLSPAPTVALTPKQSATQKDAASLIKQPIMQEGILPPQKQLIMQNNIMPPLQPPVAENDAARMALADAIMDIRKLSAEDYDVGFGTLEKALSNAEKVLANPLAELVDIRDAASNLLLAFDGLEERGEFSLSDDELDELFYHGAVLEEMAHPSANGQKLASAMMLNNAAPEVALNPANIANAEPDFAVLSDILDTISEINLSQYSAESRLALLRSLDRAQEVLRDEKSSQSMIDEIAANLLAQISKLNPSLTMHAPAIHARTSAPAPVITPITPAAMIDEMTPSAVWSQGIMMIDELAPFVTDATTREKMLRAMRPWVVGLAELVTEPARNLLKSIKAGASAGLRVYRETRNCKI